MSAPGKRRPRTLVERVVSRLRQAADRRASAKARARSSGLLLESAHEFAHLQEYERRKNGGRKEPSRRRGTK